MELRVFKETSLPAILTPSAIYLIADPNKNSTYVEMYVVDNAGTATRRIISESDIKTLIAQSVAAAGALVVVDNIAARDAIKNPSGEVFVLNATGDSTVATGGARYLYNKGVWVKISETESMDLALNWNSLQNKPTSTIAQIDAAVGAAHNHANMSTLNKLSEDATTAELLLSGVPVKTHFKSTNW